MCLVAVMEALFARMGAAQRVMSLNGRTEAAIGERPRRSSFWLYEDLRIDPGDVPNGGQDAVQSVYATGAHHAQKCL